MTTAAQPADRRAPRGVPPWLAALLAYSTLFAALAWPWLRAADRAVPGGLEVAAAGDARFLIWVLAMVARRLAADPTRLFDVPIFHPAPGQLTGSDTFLSSQLAFAPAFAATGNATLATSIVAWASYPAAAIAMDRLLVGLGCLEGVAWVAGLAFALGPLRVPANFQLLQYLNFYLPLTALVVTGLRAQPTRGRAAALTIVLGAGLLSGYYLALMLCVAALAWGAMELARPGAGRARFAGLAVAAVALALALLVGVSLPYLRRREASEGGLLTPLRALEGSAWALGTALHSSTLESGVTWALALGGLLGLGSRVSSARRAAVRGMLLVLLALAFMAGPIQYIGDHAIRLPLDLLPGPVGGFVRVPWRFVVVLGFGTALLAAALLELVVRRAPRRVGVAACAAAALALVLTRGLPLPGTSSVEITAQREPIYDRVREAGAALGPGPLLELPLRSVTGETTTDAMVGAVRHGQPLVFGYTGHPPPHLNLLVETIRRLSEGDGLADLVDMTHLRWILLRPAAQWVRPRERARIAALRGLTPVLSLDGWDLLHVNLPPAHTGWFAALAGGPRPDRTLLGTPLATLVAPAARLRAQAVRELPVRRTRGRKVRVDVELENAGREAWPVSVRSGSAPEKAVQLVVRFEPEVVTPGDQRRAVERVVALPRDVAAGETISLRAIVKAPEPPGRYRVQVGLCEGAGARFGEDRTESSHATLEVGAGAPGRGG